MSAHVDAFDLDHTLIKVNASYRFGAYLFRQKAFSIFTMLSLMSYYARYKFFGMPVFELHHKTFRRLFQGRLFKQVSQQVEAFLDESLDELYYAPALARLRLAQKKHHITAIFSSSPDFLVEPIARRLGVEYWRGSHYAVNSMGAFTTVTDVLQGEEKADLLLALVKDLGVGVEATTAYSDSLVDEAFMKVAGKAVAVNPDKKLRALSRTKGWEVI